MNDVPLRWRLRQSRDGITGKPEPGVMELVHPNGGVSAQFYDTNEEIGGLVSQLVVLVLNGEIAAEHAELRRLMRERSDRVRALVEQINDLDNEVRRLRRFKQPVDYQSIVADALLWFEGFIAAYAHRKPHRQPRIPDLQRLRELNAALQELIPHPEDTIPF